MRRGPARGLLRAALLAAFLTPAAVAQSRLYVDASAVGANNGLSWAGAYTNLQSAIAAAAGSGGQVQEIWVADGVYKPGASRAATFQLPSGVRLLGGFAGGETLAAQRDWVAHPTILSGELGDPLSQGDNCYHVVSAEDTGPGTLVDGFTITRGFANGGSTQAVGPLAFLVNAQVRFANCRFTSSGAEGDGGGLWSSGGAVHLVYCEFYKCNSAGAGGAVRQIGVGTLHAVGCRFLTNSAASNGGAVAISSFSAAMHNCEFVRNISGGSGGAFYVGGTFATAALRNCTLWQNHAQSVGGVASHNGASVAVGNCLIYESTDNDPVTNTTTCAVGVANGGTQGTNYTMLNGWTGALGGAGNFGGIPTFINGPGTDGIIGTPDDDLRLVAYSSGIDRGSTAAAPNDELDLDGNGVTTQQKIPFDALGKPRFFDIVAQTNFNGSTIDIGAHESAPLRGDMNCDGLVNNFDIEPFVLALTHPEAYAALYPGCDLMAGDINNDAWFSNFDIDPFVQCLNTFGCP
ncbi:MAG: hypothetical protein HRU75_13045 [Planctomycetia bacterium]|nr:MAG: hypothetical protein HRU75_13045 [Planctomycetia bacterium]